jgi:hypothetical protein
LSKFQKWFGLLSDRNLLEHENDERINTMKYGTYARTSPRVKVLRGYEGNESSAITTVAKITDGQTIVSGQVISLSSGTWVLGCAAGSIPHIALQDGTDTDVISSGLLLGLSCSGKYEIETAAINSALTYNEGTALKAGVTGADSENGGSTGNLGNVVPATVSGGAADILGYCTHGGKHAGGVIAIGAVDGVSVGVANSGTNSEAGNSFSTVSFITSWEAKR